VWSAAPATQNYDDRDLQHAATATKIATPLVKTSQSIALAAYNDLRLRHVIKQVGMSKCGDFHENCNFVKFRKSIAPATKRFSTRYKTRLNVTKCHACRTKRHDNLLGNIRKGEVLQLP